MFRFITIICSAVVLAFAAPAAAQAAYGAPDDAPWYVCAAFSCTGHSFAEVFLSTDDGQILNAIGGDDTVDGRDGNDDLLGGTGRDLVTGDRGYDDVWGGDSSDFLRGGKGNDALHAGCPAGCDQSGEDGEIMYGDGGDDVIYAQNGKRDYINCGDGFDIAFVDPIDVLSPTLDAIGCEDLR